MQSPLPNVPRILAVAALAILGVSAMPSAARSQSRGTLQVTATVVSASASVSGLDAAHQAVGAWELGRAAASNDVSTLAQVEVGLAAPAAGSNQGTLVVNVDFLKN
jgi:hypothetical protein